MDPLNADFDGDGIGDACDGIAPEPSASRSVGRSVTVELDAAGGAPYESSMDAPIAWRPVRPDEAPPVTRPA